MKSTEKNIDVYCLSGLGVDERAFQRLHPKGVTLKHIPWIPPQKGESLREYSVRLFNQADLPEDYSLAGVSFGGMIASEFAQIRKPKHLFLISTISCGTELPWFFKLGGFLRIYQIVPKKLLNYPNFMLYYIFSVKNQGDKELLREIVSDTDPDFLRWALGAIVRWRSQYRSEGIKIHGGSDRLLPSRGEISNTIQNGGHFIIVDRAAEIAEVIESELFDH